MLTAQPLCGRGALASLVRDRVDLSCGPYAQCDRVLDAESLARSVGAQSAASIAHELAACNTSEQLSRLLDAIPHSEFGACTFDPCRVCDAARGYTPQPLREFCVRIDSRVATARVDVPRNFTLTAWLRPRGIGIVATLDSLVLQFVDAVERAALLACVGDRCVRSIASLPFERWLHVAVRVTSGIVLEIALVLDGEIDIVQRFPFDASISSTALQLGSLRDGANVDIDDFALWHCILEINDVRRSMLRIESRGCLAAGYTFNNRDGAAIAGESLQFNEKPEFLTNPLRRLSGK